MHARFCTGRQQHKEYGPSKAEVALLGMDIEQLAKQLMKAVRDENFWDYNKQLAA